MVSRFVDVSTDAMKRGVIVCPTDTVYGLSACVDNRDAIERIYALKGRDRSRALIVLLADVGQLRDFGVSIVHTHEYMLKRVWPGPVSVIFQVSREWAHLASDDGTLAFRVPAHADLRRFLRRVGPLVSTSANIQGSPTVKSIAAAKRLFGKDVDWYIDGGRLAGPSSALVKVLR